MKHWCCMLMACMATCGTAEVALAAGNLEPGPSPQQVVPGVWMIPGGMRADRQPDGNSVVFDAPAGLVVVDTGRHAWHRRAIEDLARARKQPIVVIVNTHWHLDHVSGNQLLRAAYPGSRVYASNAIEEALQGFLAKSAADAAGYLADTTIPATMREDIRGDLSTVQAGDALKPDIVIKASGVMTLAGRKLTINLARDAVTAGDVWLFDPENRLVVLGDLVTLPAPFLDTACPDAWSAALREVAKTDFTTAIPGHGPVLNRAQFALYERTFASFIGCANSTRSQSDCATEWADAVQPLMNGGDDRAQALGLAAYYVEMLRAHDGRSEYCNAQRASTYSPGASHRGL